MANQKESVEKDVSAETAPQETDYDAAFLRHLGTAEATKVKYERLYREMVENLSTAHLEPLSTVLLEREKRTLVGQDEIIHVLKEKLLKKLLESLQISWESCNITNRLVTLEMLKERYKQFEGEDWHVQDMPPKQRMIPVRMRFKEASKRYLQKQIAFQNLNLEELIKTNSTQRERLQEVANRRVYLMEGMERETKQLAEKKQRLLELQAEVLQQPDA